MATDNNPQPITKYNFKVEIDGIAVAFTKVSGLDIKYETITYAESSTKSGSPGPRRILMPGQLKPPSEIKCEKGTTAQENFVVLYAWINSIQATRVNKKDVCVRLCDEHGDTVLSWKAINAFPTKVASPEFDAKEEKEVAIQEMTLMADRVVMELA